MIVSSLGCWASLMFPRAAFTSAARSASRPLGVNRVDLESSGPVRGCPVEFGDEAHGGDTAPACLTMPLAPLGRMCCRLLRVRCPSSGSERDREVRFFVTSAAPGAVRTYEAALRALVPKVTAKLGSQVLPVSPEDVFYAFSSAAVSLAPTAASSVSVQPAVRRSFVKVVRAAVAYWRVAR